MAKESTGMKRALAALEHGSENDVLDYKGPCAWDKAVESAKLAKDIVAFANSRGGGMLVIGVDEPFPGEFKHTGMSPEQLKSFDGTDVAKWINSRFQPPVRLSMFKPEQDQRKFVVIEVNEFDEMPSICVKEFQTQEQGTLLRRGAIYIRSANGESKPLESPDELRRLLGTATSKMGAQLTAQIHAIISGKPPAPRRSEGIEADAEAIDSLLAKYFEKLPAGRWICRLVPQGDAGLLFEDLHKGRALLRETQSQYFGWRYPYRAEDVKAQEWGVAYLGPDDAFALSERGVFHGVAVRNSESDGATSSRGTEWEAGKYINFHEMVFGCASRMEFMAHLAARLPPDLPVLVEYGATALRGRKLVVTDPGTFWPDLDKPGEAEKLAWSRTISAGELAAGWTSLCVDVLYRLGLLVGAEQLKKPVIEGWVNKYAGRER